MIKWLKKEIETFTKITLALLLLVGSCFTQASEQLTIKVAVASNFKSSLSEIAQNYEVMTGQKVLISSASTGTLYNQIRHGAPFDIFLSADKKRAKLIEESEFGVKGTRFTYAQGQIAFWAPKENSLTFAKLKQFTGQLAIANPKLAPYGVAAMESLKSMQLWSHFSYVKGANISQTFQFIESGNVQAGFVAYAQIIQNKEIKSDSYFVIPADLHREIVQQGVLLSAATQPVEAQKFIDYLNSSKVKSLIRDKGYL